MTNVSGNPSLAQSSLIHSSKFIGVDMSLYRCAKVVNELKQDYILFD